MFFIHCRDFGRDCNAVMKGNDIDAVVSAAMNHAVGMHKQVLKELQTHEKRKEIELKVRTSS